MEILVLINNNLCHDSRVKRHISAISECAESVHVLARPIPDDTVYISKKNVETSFFRYEQRPYPITPQMRKFAAEYGIKRKLIKCFPLLGTNHYYNDILIERCVKKLDKTVRKLKIEDIYNRQSEEMEMKISVSYPLSFMDTSIQFAQEALKIKADIVWCNDIDTLLAGVIHKQRWNSRLIYDVHDIFEDMSPGVFPQIYSNVLTLFHNTFIKYADVVMGIGRYELKWLRDNYQIKAPCIPVLNCSETKACDLESKDYSCNPLRIYYHGMSDESRGLNEILEAVLHFPELVLVLRCLPSENLQRIKDYVKEKKIEEKVVFLDPVSPDMIAKSAQRDGDVGIHICDTENCVNWKIALTNKFIEYSKAGLPIITSETNEQMQFINEYKNGFLVKSYSEEAVIVALDEMLQNRTKLQECAKASLILANEVFDWTKYREILQGIIYADSETIDKNRIRM